MLFATGHLRDVPALRAMDGFIDVSSQGRNVLLAQGHDLLILSSPVLGLLFRRLLDATLKLALGLLEIGLLRYAAREQRKTRSDERQQDRPRARARDHLTLQGLCSIDRSSP